MTWAHYQECYPHCEQEKAWFLERQCRSRLESSSLRLARDRGETIQQCPMHGTTPDPTPGIMRRPLTTGDARSRRHRRRTMPEMIYVDSSSIEAIGYDADAGELHVRFLSGASYIYRGVPAHIFDALMQSPSKGSFINREIKGVYQYTKT